MADEWDKENVVVPQVDGVAIHWNGSADIVIRQKDSLQNDDSVIVIPFAHLKAIITRLQQMAKNRPEPDEP